MAIIQAMNHFTALSSDLEATRRFYGELLGLEDQRGAALDFYRGRLAEL